MNISGRLFVLTVFTNYSIKIKVILRNNFQILIEYIGKRKTFKQHFMNWRD